MTIAPYAHEWDAPQQPLGRFAAALADSFRWLASWRREQRTVLRASDLPDALLKDMGLTRDQFDRISLMRGRDDFGMRFNRGRR
jgi:uncharacterized protein YjiS (DUF1127 family)